MVIILLLQGSSSCFSLFIKSQRAKELSSLMHLLTGLPCLIPVLSLLPRETPALIIMWGLQIQLISILTVRLPQYQESFDSEVLL